MKEWIVVVIWATMEKTVGAKRARAFAVRHLGEVRTYEIEHGEGFFG